MNLLILLAHPRQGSLNHSLAERLKDNLSHGHTIFFHDLYAERFDPLLKENELLDKNEFSEDVLPYCRELQIADAVIIIHPNWWGQPPAILKGWIDRVIRLGVGYGFEDNGEGAPVKLLAIRNFFVFNTSNTSEEREHTVFHDPLEYIWKECIAGFLQAEKFDRSVFRIVITSTPEEREQWVRDSLELVNQRLSS